MAQGGPLPLPRGGTIHHLRDVSGCKLFIMLQRYRDHERPEGGQVTATEETMPLRTQLVHVIREPLSLHGS